MDFKIFFNKKFLFILLVLDFTGIFASLYTYTNDIYLHINSGNFFVIPFFLISFWLYLFSFIFILYLYLGKKTPGFLGGMIFIFTFVYGLGSIIFYPLFMLFVKGFSVYNLWNVLAHGFVGLQSILFLKNIKIIKSIHFIALFLLFLFKNVIDLFYGGFVYFTNFNFSLTFKAFLIFMIIIMQVLAFYLLYKFNKKA